MSYFYNLYELAVITILLQNVTVGRTTKMLQGLLNKYGTTICFDERKMYAFWEPAELAQASYGDLRALSLGYRAKFLQSLSQSFSSAEIDEKALRHETQTELRRKLMKLKGIRPVSAQTIIVECFRRYGFLESMPPWETKIYSIVLFGHMDTHQEEVIAEIRRRWGKWKALAVHYIIEDLFWRRKSEAVEWLEKLIRL